MSTLALKTPRGWPAWVPLLLVQAVIVAALWDTAVGMVAIWERSGTYTHAYAVLPIVLWLVWRQRDRLARIEVQPSLVAALMMLPISGLWLLGELAAVNVVTHLALVTLLVVAVPAVLGWALARALMFPLAFAFFMVPVGDFMMPSMMQWTAEFTVRALRLTGIPVYQEGLRFVIPTGSWSVVEACSGIRYLIASLTVGALYAYLTYRSARKRWLFMLVALLVPIVANWFRAYLIVMLGHFSGNKLAAGADHLVYGWVFFGIVVMAMFWLGGRWADDAPAVDSPGTKGAVSMNPLNGLSGDVPDADVSARSTARMPIGMARASVFAVGLVAVLVGPAIYWATDSSQGPREMDLTPMLPREAVAEPLTDWAPVFEQPNAVWKGRWAGTPEGVGLHLVGYRAQTKERKLLSSVNVPVRADDPRWVLAGGVQRLHSTVAGHPLPVQEFVVQRVGGNESAREAWMAWQVLVVDARAVSPGALGRLAAARGRLMGRGDDAFAVTLLAPVGQEGIQVTRRTLESALQGVWPELAQGLSKIDTF